MLELLPLESGTSGKVPANGIVQLELGPATSNEWWFIEANTVQNTGSVLVPDVLVYRNVVAAVGFIEWTAYGSFAMSDTRITVKASEKVIWAFSNCDVGSTCTVTVRGLRRVNF